MSEPRGHAFLPVSVDAVAALALPHMPKGSAIWAVGLTARGKLAFVTFTVPGAPMLSAFVIPEMANPFSMAAAVCTATRGITDDECEHTCMGLTIYRTDGACDDEEDDDAPVSEVRRYHA